MSYADLASIRAYLDQLPESAQQTITVASGATGGTFTITADGETSAPIAYNASAGAVRAALEAMGGFGPGEALGQTGLSPIVVRGRPGGPWRIRFDAPIGDDAPYLTVSGAGLTGTGASVRVDLTVDLLLQDALDRATGWIDAFLAPISFDDYPAASARRVAGLGETTLYLPAHMAGSVTAVTYGTTTITDYEVLPSGNLYRQSAWALTQPNRSTDDVLAGAPLGWRPAQADWAFLVEGAGHYEVTARWGYGPPPAEVEQLCLELAVGIWRLRERGMVTEAINADGGGRSIYAGGINKTQAALLNAIRAELLEQAV